MFMITENAITLDCCTTASIPSNCEWKANSPPEKRVMEKKMYDTCEEDFNTLTVPTENERKASFLCDELSQVDCVKNTQLRKEFKIDLQVCPDSPKEYVQWIKDGWYKFDVSSTLTPDGDWVDADRWNGDGLHHIKWMNPNRDVSGFAAAEKQKDAAFTDAYRQIKIGTPEEGLKALKEFEFATFH